MAEVIKEVLSFDLNADKAVAQVQKYVTELQKLEKEQADLAKQGKDLSQVNAQIEASTKKLNQALNQEATTLKGAEAQTKALGNAKKQLSAETSKGITLNARLARSTSNLGGALATAVQGSSSLREGLKNIGDQALAAGAAFGVYGIAGALAFQAITPFIVDFIEAQKTVSVGLERAKKDFEGVEAVTKKVSEANKGATVASSDLGAAILKESKAAAGLLGELANVNTSTERRKEVIAQLQAEYGAYLANIDLETASMEQLRDAINAVTLANAERFIREKAQEETNKVIGSTVEILAKRIEAEKELNKQISVQGEIEAGLFNQRRKQNPSQAFIEEQEALLKEQKQIVAQRQTNFRALDKQFAEAQAEADRIAQEQLDLINNSQQIANLFRSEGVKSFNQAARGTAKASKQIKQNTKEQKDEYVILAGSLAALEAELSRVNKLIDEQVQAGDTENLKILGSEYIKVKKQVDEAREAIEFFKTEQERKPAINVQAIGFDTDALREASRISSLVIQLDELEISGIKDVTGIEQARASAIRQAEALGQDIEAVNKRFDKQRLEAEQDNAIRRTRIELQLAQAKLKSLNEGSAEYRKQALEVEKLGLKLTELENKGVKGADATAKAAQNAGQKIAQLTQGIQGLSDILFQTLSQNAAGVTAQFTKAVEAQRSTLDALVSNVEQTNARQIEVEQKRLDALEERQAKAAKREEIIKQAQIAINLALTVARAAAEGGGIGSAFTIATALAAAIAGFAAARNASTAAFFEGTDYVPLGGNRKGRDTIPARLHEGEAVISADTNKRYHPAIKAIRRELVNPDVLNSFINYASGGANMDWIKGLGMANLSPDAKNILLVKQQAFSPEVVSLLKQIASKEVNTTSVNITERGLTRTVTRNVSRNQNNNKKYGG